MILNEPSFIDQIAEQISLCRPLMPVESCPKNSPFALAHIVVDDVAVRLALLFKHDDPKFDSQKFLDLCGVK